MLEKSSACAKWCWNGASNLSLFPREQMPQTLACWGLIFFFFLQMHIEMQNLLEKWDSEESKEAL